MLPVRPLACLVSFPSPARLWHIGVAVVGLVLALATSGCQAPCAPDNCFGCCAADGQCVAPSASACGGGGAACTPCGPAQQCLAGRCVGQSPPGGSDGGPPGCTPESDPDFCQRHSATCGPRFGVDNCGSPRTVASCGSCPVEKRCDEVAGACVCNPESDAAFCARLGKACGTVTATDNCGRARTVSSCGTCPAAQQCGAGGVPNACGCTPENDATFCARLGKNCGSVSAPDNCGQRRTVSTCGTCGPQHTCGGGGTANVCGCPAETDAAFCARLGKDCGSVSALDRCGAQRTAQCGTCRLPQTCGGGGVANGCGCTPETDAAFCARLGRNCGNVTGTDNCGARRTVASCGTCTTPQTCGGAGIPNVCACPPESTTAFCARLGKNCGSVTGTDSCGSQRTASCGSCPLNQSCGGGGTANVCGCTPPTDAQLCAASNTTCGSLTNTDGCGQVRTVASCGSCASGTRCPTTGPSNRACQPFTCSTGQLACGASCATCPTVGVATTQCGPGDTCVAATCATDFTLVNGACQPVVCPAGQRSCGGACRTCPTSGVLTTTCSGPACLAASCIDGWGVSGGACVQMSCPTGRLYCSTACAPCPTTGGATYVCAGSTCLAQTCAAGYSLLNGSCIDSDWTVELIDPSASDLNSNQPRSAAIAVDPAGTPYVGYSDPPNVVVARRTSAGWVRMAAVPLGASGLTAVTALAVDSAGNAHVVYYTYKGVSFSNGTFVYRYVKLSPSGATSLPIELGETHWGGGGSLDAEEGVALAVDSAGDAHVAFNSYVSGTNRLLYRRTFGGAWLAPMAAVSAAWPFPAIAVDSQGTVHLAGFTGSQWLYTRGVNSIFSAPLSATATTSSFTEMQLFLSGSNVQLWGRSGRNYHWASVGAAALSTPVVWGALTGNPSHITGAAGPPGFSMLEQPSWYGPVTATSGPSSGPTVVETTNLSLGQLSPGSVMGATGTLHALSWINSGSGADALYYVRGH